MLVNRCNLHIYCTGTGKSSMCNTRGLSVNRDQNYSDTEKTIEMVSLWLLDVNKIIHCHRPECTVASLAN